MAAAIGAAREDDALDGLLAGGIDPVHYARVGHAGSPGCCGDSGLQARQYGEMAMLPAASLGVNESPTVNVLVTTPVARSMTETVLV